MGISILHLTENKGGRCAMKRIITFILTMSIMLLFLGGCFFYGYDDDRGGGRDGYNRDGGYDRGSGGGHRESDRDKGRDGHKDGERDKDRDRD